MLKVCLNGRRHKVLLSLLFILGAATLCPCQQVALDLNSYYQFPLSLGVEYQSLTPLVTYPSGAPYALLDLGLSLRWPIPLLPVLQPTLRAGSR